MVLPLLGWAAVAVGSVVVGAVVSSSSSSSSSSSTVSDRDEREEEALEEAKKTRNKKIIQDIKRYKKRQINRFKEKYDLDIQFDDGGGLTIFNNESIEDNESPIQLLKKETDELELLILKLEKMKDEAIS